MNEHLARLLRHPYVGELRELANVYEIGVGGVQVTVKVYRYPYAETYVAVPDHGVRRPGETVPYRRMEHMHTPEEAVADAIDALLEHYNPDEGHGCLSLIG